MLSRAARGSLVAAGLVAGAAGLHALQPGAPSGPSPRSALADAVKAYDAAVLRMDADAIAAMYAPDGEAWNAGTLIARGPKTIAAFLHTFDGKARVLSQATHIDSIVLSGNTGTVVGTYRQTTRLLEAGRTVTVTGRIHSEWVRTSATTWRIRRLETTPDGRRVHRGAVAAAGYVAPTGEAGETAP